MTDIGEPALVRASSIEIVRGSVLAGRYQVEAVIGKGGSGIVLRAFDRVAQVAVAVKILKPDLAADPRWIERFSRELRLARQIQHPNVCRVFDIGQADGHWFITMELATGGTLRDQLGENAAKRSIEEKLSDIRAVVAGLAAIHEAGIVHRDLKPDNFLRMADGRLVLSDFGLATNPADAPTVSIMVGTPHYMAPEVVMGEAASPSSDVWSAGVVVHEILVGARPARGPRWRSEVASQQVTTRVEKALLDVCVQCLGDEGEGRLPDGTDLERKLVAALATSGRSGSVQQRMIRSRRVWIFATLAVCSAFAFATRSLWQPARGSSVGRESLSTIAIEGEPRDWSAVSSSIAKFSGTVHCLDLISNGEIARVIWGTPRRAEDIDTATGFRTPSKLIPAAYEIDCPRLSPRGDTLLFTRLSSGGTPEIVRAAPDGSAPVTLRPGTEPLWLPGGEEFLFNVDAGNVGLFSLPTMSYSLLLDGHADARRHVHDKAVSATGDLVAVTYTGEQSDRQLALFSLPGLSLLKSWQVPKSVVGVGFDDGSLTLSDVSGQPGLLQLDWSRSAAQRRGFIPGAEIHSTMALPGNGHLIATRTRSSDIWIFDNDGQSHRLTHDGESYAGSVSPSGEALVKRTNGTNQVIFRYDRNGRGSQVTNGPSDMSPSFAPDGSSWLYADVQRKTIVRCEASGCRDLWTDPLVPTEPVMAPDNKHIAYVTPVGSPRIHIIDGDGGNERDLGPTAQECPPVWSSPTSLWEFTGAGSQRAWVEIDVRTGSKTGRTKAATTFNPDEQTCGWEAELPGSAFFQRARAVRSEGWELRRTAAPLHISER